MIGQIISHYRIVETLKNLEGKPTSATRFCAWFSGYSADFTRQPRSWGIVFRRKTAFQHDNPRQAVLGISAPYGNVPTWRPAGDGDPHQSRREECCRGGGGREEGWGETPTLWLGRRRHGSAGDPEREALLQDRAAHRRAADEGAADLGAVTDRQAARLDVAKALPDAPHPTLAEGSKALARWPEQSVKVMNAARVAIYPVPRLP